ncbi:hypothetical protein D3C73_1598400 [compost metagenome]
MALRHHCQEPPAILQGFVHHPVLLPVQFHQRRTRFPLQQLHIRHRRQILQKAILLAVDHPATFIQEQMIPLL